MAVFVTDGPWGTGLARLLLPAEIDTNFWELITRLVALETDLPQPNEITSIEVVGTQMTIFLADGTELGPVTLPIATMKYLGDWQTGTFYPELSLVREPTQGLFLVLREHTATATTFDPNEVNVDSLPLYLHILPISAGDIEWAMVTAKPALIDALPADVGAEAQVLTMQSGAVVWGAGGGGGGSSIGLLAGHSWRLVFRETLVGSIGILEMEYRATAGVAQPATDGTPFATNLAGTNEMFDGNDGTVGYVDDPQFGDYVGVSFESFTAFAEFAIKLTSSSENDLNDFDIEYSNDGISWTTVAEVRGAAIIDSTWRVFPLTAVVDPGSAASEVGYDNAASGMAAANVQAALDELAVPFDDAEHGARGGGTLHPAATPSVAGFLSAADKSKLDGIEAGATADQTTTEIRDALLIFSGAGTPEGVKTAPVGALFTRTDGGAGTTLYVKESGTGNTGWIAK